MTCSDTGPPSSVPPHKQAKKMAPNMLPQRRCAALHINYLQEKVLKRHQNDPQHKEDLVEKFSEEVTALYNKCQVMPKPPKLMKQYIRRFLEQKRDYA